MSVVNALFGGNSIFSALINLASLAFPPLQMAAALLGGLSQAFMQGIQQGLGQAMQALGMPKFVADLVSKALQDAFGGAAQNASQLGQQAGEGMKSYLEQFTKGIAESFGNELEKSSSATGGGKKGWLRAIAEALGNIANKAAEELKTMGDGITKDDPKALTEYQAATQEFSLLMNTFTNAIKTLGEANANAVRKG